MVEQLNTMVRDENSYSGWVRIMKIKHYYGKEVRQKMKFRVSFNWPSWDLLVAYIYMGTVKN